MIENNKRVLIIVGVILVAVIMGITAAFMLMNKSAVDSQESESKSASTASLSPSPNTSSASDWIDSIDNNQSLQSLSSNQQLALQKAVTNWGKKNYINVETLSVMKDEAGAEFGRAIIFKLGSTQKFIVAQENPDGTWGVIKLLETIEGVNDSGEENPWLTEMAANQDAQNSNNNEPAPVKELDPELEEMRRQADAQAAQDTRMDSGTPPEKESN